VKESRKKERNKTRHNADGISAGIKLVLFFIISFYFLNYPPLLAILLGLVGGSAGGMIVAWWKSPHNPRQDVTDAIVPEMPRYKTKIGYAQHQRGIREKNTPLDSIFNNRRNSGKKGRGGRK
jgi:hypothetical protein